MNKILRTSLIYMGLLLLPISAQAYTIVGADPGTTEYVGSVSEVATGPDMAGMLVTVTGLNYLGNPFSDSTRVWVKDLSVNLSPPVYGGIISVGDGRLFYLFQAGDTYTNSWVLYSYYQIYLSTITIDALPGNVVFDRTIDGSEKTPGSGQGKDFSTAYSGPPNFPAFATYRNQVALDGQAPQGDLYRTLEISWTNGVFFNDSIFYELFTSDTDRITASVVPVPLVAPLGSGLSFFATGLLGLIGLRRKVRG